MPRTTVSMEAAEARHYLSETSGAPGRARVGAPSPCRGQVRKQSQRGDTRLPSEG
jgi:hypothetical protein